VNDHFGLHPETPGGPNPDTKAPTRQSVAHQIRKRRLLPPPRPPRPPLRRHARRLRPHPLRRRLQRLQRLPPQRRQLRVGGLCHQRQARALGGGQAVGGARQAALFGGCGGV